MLLRESMEGAGSAQGGGSYWHSQQGVVNRAWNGAFGNPWRADAVWELTDVHGGAKAVRSKLQGTVNRINRHNVLQGPGVSHTRGKCSKNAIAVVAFLGCARPFSSSTGR